MKNTKLSYKKKHSLFYISTNLLEILGSFGNHESSPIYSQKMFGHQANLMALSVLIDVYDPKAPNILERCKKFNDHILNLGQSVRSSAPKNYLQGT